MKSVIVKIVNPSTSKKPLRENPFATIAAIVKEIKTRSAIGNEIAKNASEVSPPKWGRTGLSARVDPKVVKPSPTIEASRSSRIENLRTGFINLGIAIIAKG